MKVRWMSDSLRLRITPTELATLASGGPVTEAAAFPGGWSVTIAPAGATALRGEGPGASVFTLSADDLTRLLDPAQEGVYFQTEGIRYFIEKDFPCVTPRPALAQESTETFAPPPGFADRHGPGR